MNDLEQPKEDQQEHKPPSQGKLAKIALEELGNVLDSLEGTRIKVQVFKVIAFVVGRWWGTLRGVLTTLWEKKEDVQ